MEIERVKAAVSELLDALELGIELDERDLTSMRVAALWTDLLSGEHEEPSSFLRGGFSEGYTEMVALRDIPFFSMCEHHLLPFFGKVHIAYLPGSAGRIAGASNLAKVVLSVSRRLQIQERLTYQVAAAIRDGIDASGVMVVAYAEHLCITMKDRTDLGSRLVTTASTGLIETDRDLRAQAMSMLTGAIDSARQGPEK